ncbi:Lysosome-associated membrane glycoprotein 1 [Homalodisca vitripennis]|nr:Lysosome-associated membrane glycoprotein 1 [Homalodisca vitripennis]
MPCDRSTNRKHRRPAKNKVKLTSLQCRMASDIRAERQNSNVGRRPTYERKGPVFSLPLNNSYTCYEVDALPFNGTAGNTTVKATVELKQIQVEAFGTGKKPNYYAPLDCTSGDTPDIVPIAVGLILAGLVVVVLIAYLVGRRRAQARGYLSM